MRPSIFSLNLSHSSSPHLYVIVLPFCSRWKWSPIKGAGTSPGSDREGMELGPGGRFIHLRRGSGMRGGIAVLPCLLGDLWDDTGQWFQISLCCLCNIYCHCHTIGISSIFFATYRIRLKLSLVIKLTFLAPVIIIWYTR
jgi:hypothetical protein